jgi:hypothetical protein
MGYAAGLNDVPEEIEIREIEPHEKLTFLFYEGRLRKRHIAPPDFRVQASQIMK